MLALWRGLFIRRSHPRTINRCSTIRAPNPQRLPTIRCSPPSKATIILFSVPIDNSLWGYAEPPKVVPVILYSFLRHVTLGIHPMIDYTQLERYYVPIYFEFFSWIYHCINFIQKKKKKYTWNLFFLTTVFRYPNYILIISTSKGNWTKANYLKPTLPFRKFVPPPE